MNRLLTSFIIYLAFSCLCSASLDDAKKEAIKYMQHLDTSQWDKAYLMLDPHIQKLDSKEDALTAMKSARMPFGYSIGKLKSRIYDKRLTFAPGDEYPERKYLRLSFISKFEEIECSEVILMAHSAHTGWKIMQYSPEITMNIMDLIKQ